MKYFMTALDTPVGELALVTTEHSVVALLWDKNELPRLGIPSWEPGPSCDLLEEAEKQLREYLSGERSRFELPLEPRGTPFQQRVWSALCEIPFGQTWSYQRLALRVENPGAMRAVGSANGRNPLCIFIPCHRVVRLSGELGGYTGGLDKKTFLLKLESEAAARPLLPDGRTTPDTFLQIV